MFIGQTGYSLVTGQVGSRLPRGEGTLAQEAALCLFVFPFYTFCLLPMVPDWLHCYAKQGMGTSVCMIGYTQDQSGERVCFPSLGPVQIGVGTSIYLTGYTHDQRFSFRFLISPFIGFFCVCVIPLSWTPFFFLST